MGALYRVNLYDPYGNQLALLDDFSGLNYTLKLNDYGNHQFNLPIDNRELHKLFSKDCIVEIQRAVPEYGIDWYDEYVGFHISPQRQITEAGNKFFTSYGRTFDDLLHRCWIAYYPGTAFTNKSGAADNVMKAIVRENVGPNLSGSRLLNVSPMPNFTVTEDTSQGPPWSGTFAYRNVLATLQEAGLASLIDFRVIRVRKTPVQFAFITSTLLGDDHSVGTQLVIFSTEFGNVKQVSYTNSATDEITAVLVLGQGLETNRALSSALAVSISDSPYNRKEHIKDARNQGSSVALEAEARELLRASASQESFTFEALQDSQFVYGRDYFLGDRVILQFEEIRRVKRLVGLTMTLEENGVERFNMEFADYVASPRSDDEIIRNLVNMLSKVENSGDI